MRQGLILQYAVLLAVLGHSAQSLAAPSPASPPSVEQSFQWLGNILIIEAGCSDGAGYATASLTAVELPGDFANWNVSCFFADWPTAQLAFGPEASPQQSLEARDLLLRKLANGTSFPASLVSMASSNASITGEAAGTNTSTFMAQCRIAASEANTTIVLLAQNATGQIIGVPPSVPLARPAFRTINPLLGPASGGTNVTIEGEGFKGSANCTFSNSTTSVTVAASSVNDTGIICTTPPWRSDLSEQNLLSMGMAGTELISLMVSAGECVTVFPFQLYSEPKVLGLFPLQGPRYGSFDLKVNLGYSLSSFAEDGMESIQPAIRIKGGDLDGSDLTLSANLTSDRMALTASTPLERAPLATGNHEVHVSLNGQQFAEQGPIKSTVLTVEGPTLSMDQPYYSVEAGTKTVPLTLSLEGDNRLPVSAELSVTIRSLQASENLTHNHDHVSIEPQSLKWESGEGGAKTVNLIFDRNFTALEQGGVIVNISSAENADISELKRTSIVSNLTRSKLVVGFDIATDQVVYRGMNASLPISIQNAALRLPAAIQYNLTDLFGRTPVYINPDKAAGVLQWDIESGDMMELELGIDWENVSLPTEDHLVMNFGDVWNARTDDSADTIALHVFGVGKDQCPPGTFKIDRTKAPPPGLPWHDFDSSAGWLKSLRVQDADDWYFELSSLFQSDVAEYGVIVPARTGSANLCLESKLDYGVITVLDASGNPMQQDVGIVPSQAFKSKSFYTLGNRKLTQLGSANLPPAPTPNYKSQAPTTLPSFSGPPCGGSNWALPLLPGQNVFTISHGPDTVVALTPSATLAAAKAGKLNGTSRLAPAPSVGSTDMTYSLSVVQLADPTHAELLQLNVTAGNTSFMVCTAVKSAEDSQSALQLDIPTCEPSSTMYVNVSYDTAIMGLYPRLRYPDVQRIRVEVAGQVLSQGGNVAADQLADTSDIFTQRSNTSFLPAAYIVGLQAGVSVEIPIVIVAEDGVTSLRYYVSVYKDLPTSGEDENSLNSAPNSDDDSDGYLPITLGLANTLGNPPPPPAIPLSAQAHANWPVPPSRQPQCHACLPGWASTNIDQSHCNLCMPGSFSADSQSPSCDPCFNGTYTNSWGSTNCNHCITGTFAPSKGSHLCFMCPENMTNLEDGSSQCDVPLRPGTNLLMRYAVIVSFGVYLNGTSLDTIASKVGVNASSRSILQRLISTDTASAFNITARDVNVTGIQQVGRRVLLVNVTATLGLDLPSNSSNNAVQMELAMKNLSADEAIHMLSLYPDKFLARTTKALDVTAAQGDSPASKVESRPKGAPSGSLLPWYGILLIIVGSFGLLGMAYTFWRRRKSKQRCWPRKTRSYSIFTEGNKEGEIDAEDGGTPSIGPRNLGNLVSRGRNLSSVSNDNLPMLNQTISSS